MPGSARERAHEVPAQIDGLDVSDFLRALGFAKEHGELRAVGPPRDL
jgi:hypothetical protein